MLMEGFSMVLSDPLSVVLVAVGTLIGTIFGAIPGLTATMAVTICLPMTFAMSDSRAIALLMALYIGGISGGLVSSILLNIPGTPASMVTAFDGAPMARKGEGAKALGTGIFFSFLGTIFGLIALIIIAPYLAAVAIKFGAFEYCALSIFSLSLVISLAGKDMVKGLAAALLGVMFSTFDSIVRYDFGSVNMQSGFQQLVVLIGLYAIPEVVGVAQKVVKPKVIMKQNPADVEALMACKTEAGETVDEALKNLILVIKENIKVRRFVRYEGVCSAYVHGGGTHGILVNFETTNGIEAKDEFAAYGKDIAMQVAAANPGYVDEASVPAEVVAKEKEIMLAQMAQDPKTANKPEAVKQKMIEGKIKKFFKENCLVDQEFVKDGDLTVAQYTAKVAKDLGGEIKIVKFARFVKGEGLEKRADDFASEVASMVK